MYIVVISDPKWSTTHKVFKSHRSKISIICAQVPKNRTSCAQVHKLPQSHCGWKPGGHIVFMITYICCLWHCFHDIYIYIYIILYYTILYYTIQYYTRFQYAIQELQLVDQLCLLTDHFMQFFCEICESKLPFC